MDSVIGAFMLRTSLAAFLFGPRSSITIAILGRPDSGSGLTRSRGLSSFSGITEGAGLRTISGRDVLAFLGVVLSLPKSLSIKSVPATRNTRIKIICRLCLLLFIRFRALGIIKKLTTAKPGANL